MSDTVRCPDCGHDNPPGATGCAQCNFPLVPDAHGKAAAAPQPSAAASSAPAIPRPTRPPRPIRPIRPRRPRPQSNQALTLWLAFGAIAALTVIYVAIQANVERAQQPVEGAGVADQHQVDSLRAVLERDSTDVETRIRLADILYNTANWSDAIVQYRSAVHHDSTRATAIVDLGVCYFNLSDAEQAERLFQLALIRDPHQAVALFNLGIVHEQRSDWGEALKYFHRALQSDPPEDMRKPLMDAMERVMKQQGKSAPPLGTGG